MRGASLRLSLASWAASNKPPFLPCMYNIPSNDPTCTLEHIPGKQLPRQAGLRLVYCVSRCPGQEAHLYVLYSWCERQFLSSAAAYATYLDKTSGESGKRSSVRIRVMLVWMARHIPVSDTYDVPPVFQASIRTIRNVLERGLMGLFPGQQCHDHH